MSRWIPEAATELDVCLAEAILEGGGPVLRDASRRTSRDARWILGLLGLRGLRVTENDVLAVLEQRPGRFRPEHVESAWIRGFRRAIDAIDRAADFGRLPTRQTVQDLIEALGDAGSCVRNLPRTDLPWDAIEGVDYVPVDRAAEVLDQFSVESAWRHVHGTMDAGPSHPVRSAAAVCRAFVELSPFVDFNLPIACLVASQVLESSGYPTFLVHAGDRGTLREVIKEPLPIYEHWFAEVVLASWHVLGRSAA
ncbi:MAG: hypothetical protein KDC95_01815 [Planctomycetes bacterium]|nr:hypothetical protein [Planctomycetota bacterium]